METHVAEVAPGIYRFSTYIAEADLRFNQFLIEAEEPLLFHCGLRALYPAVSAAAARIMPLERLRWITFGHVEADECGTMNEWLAAAPHSEVAHGVIGCQISLNDLAARPPRMLADGEVLDLGGKRIRHLDTPHVPHGWEARVLFEETTKTLLCGDLFTQLGDGPVTTDGDLVSPAMETEVLFRATCLTPLTGATIRRLAHLRPETLCLMHGPTFTGDCVHALEELAAGYDELLSRALSEAER